MTTARAYLAGCGLQTAGLAFGGTAGGVRAATEEYTNPSFAVKTITTSTS